MGRDRLLRKLVRERFVVTLLSGQTFSGLLDETDQAHLVLVAASSISDGSYPVNVDGQLFLPREQIAYMQRIPA